jgi:hypothetical protein
MNTLFAVTAERSRQFRFVGVAVVLMAAVVLGVMLAMNANRTQPTRVLPVGAIGSPSVDEMTLVSSQTAFTCASSTLTAKGAPATSFVDALRTGTHAGYDRVVVEFKNAQPGSITIRPQAGTTFNQSPSGKAVKVAGRHGILVIIRGADAHTAFSGVRDLRTSYPSLVETRVLEDFEGQVSLGLGVSQTSCYRASIFANPVRLVIDVQTS